MGLDYGQETECVGWCVRTGRHSKQQRCSGDDFITLHHITLYTTVTAGLQNHVKHPFTSISRCFVVFMCFFGHYSSLLLVESALRESSSSYVITSVTKLENIRDKTSVLEWLWALWYILLSQLPSLSISFSAMYSCWIKVKHFKKWPQTLIYP